MKKILLLSFVLLIIILGVAAWIFLGSATKFDAPKKILYIRTNAANKKAVIDSLQKNNIIGNSIAFNWLAGQMNYWKNIKPGKYEITKGTSVLNLVRMLRNGKQTPVNFTIIKIRTKEDLARMSGNKFEFDSAQMMSFLNNADSLKRYNTDTGTALSLIIPDTYTFFWNTTPSQVYEKFSERSKRFWTPVRKKEAEDHGLTPLQGYILASIIEEETNNNTEKGNITSVYLNRINKGMPLQADPTIKYALHNFGLRRIYEKYLFVESPYNTYRNKGLPPGPICTPSTKTIDAVLTSPTTVYLYFVANSSFNGTHVFSSNYKEHMQNAHLYQQALNKQDSIKKAKELPE